MARTPGLQPAGAVIRDRRQRQGITIGEFAQRVFVSESHLGNIERGRMKASVETLARIALALGCSLDELIDSSRPVSPRPPAGPRPPRPPRTNERVSA